MTSILWLMRDFRFLDNAALEAAARAGPVLPVFLMDATVALMGAAPRWRLQAALEAFDWAWQARTGQRLTVLQGEAADVLPALAARHGAHQIVQNDWPWAPVKAAQSRLQAALAGRAVELKLYAGHLLINPARVMQSRATAYRVYTPFARMVQRLGPDLPAPYVGTITALPSEHHLEDNPPLAPDMFGGAEVLARHTLPVGEPAALERLEGFLSHPQGYAANRDHPAIDAGSGLSEHLALGEISPRLIWARSANAIWSNPLGSTDLAKFQSELLWREFAWHLMLEFPQMAERAWRPDWQDFPWIGENAQALAWRQARTGVPIVDAGLREMRITGRMHNRVRMVVASWLTKHLLTDWRIGLHHFADSLTDWDPASNAMNWQWVAGCGPDAAPFFRIFNPLRQAAQYDPDGRYIRRWCGEDSELDAAWLHSIPHAWRRLPRPRLVTEADLKTGRDRALRALQDHKGDPAL